MNEGHTTNRTTKVLSLFYGLFCYLIFFATFLYAIGFIGNFVVPKSIDSGSERSLVEGLTVDVLLLGLFALQHSVMARPAFKRWWTRTIPSHMERSTYVLASSLALIMLFWQWRPLPEIIWDVEQPAGHVVLWVFFGAGWMVVLISTFLIDHFDLFGLRHVYLHAQGQPYIPPPFRTPALYKIVRHPIMLGFLIGFWATPTMTWGHLLFAGITTAYIFVGIILEERDMKNALGERYEDYRKQVGMLLPRLGANPNP